MTTDARGHFLLGEIAPGRYALRAVTGAATPPDVPVTVEGAWTVTVTMRLPPSFRDSLDVTASVPTEAVATRASVGGESIAHSPVRIRARGLQDVVATLPGWATEDNGLLHSRGVDDGFLYVVDGVPVYERLDQTSGVAPDTSTIDAITVVTGYVPPEFGYKAGGVIEFRTRAATDAWKGSYELGVGSDAAFESSATRRRSRLAHGMSLWLGAAGQRSDRFLDPVHPDNLHNAGASLSTSGQLDATAGARDRIVGGFGYGRTSFDVPNTETQEEAGQHQRQRVGQGFLTASWQRTWSARTVSQVAGYHRETSARLGGSPFDTPITADASRAAHTHGRARRRRASTRSASRQGRRRSAAASSARGVRLCGHRRRRGGGGRPQRRSLAARRGQPVPFSGDAHVRRCGLPTCRTRGSSDPT